MQSNSVALTDHRPRRARYKLAIGDQQTGACMQLAESFDDAFG
jgi:hypothetical protein